MPFVGITKTQEKAANSVLGYVAAQALEFPGLGRALRGKSQITQSWYMTTTEQNATKILTSHVEKANTKELEAHINDTLVLFN